MIVDTPAALEPRQLPELTRDADKILVPVLPSDIDIHACSRCIHNLLLVAKIRREDNRLGVIANRVRRNTLIYQSLIRFLQTLGIPIVATLRDSQNYVRAAELGVGVHEMKSYVAQRRHGAVAAAARVAGAPARPPAPAAPAGDGAQDALPATVPARQCRGGAGAGGWAVDCTPLSAASLSAEGVWRTAAPCAASARRLLLGLAGCRGAGAVGGAQESRIWSAQLL